MKPTRLLLSFLLTLGSLFLCVERAEAAPSSVDSGWCRSTENPGVIVENAWAKLVWDEYGNLTLVNHAGSGTQTTWGINSTVPLTGSSAGLLCFGDAGWGRLRIVDSNNTQIWKSGSYQINATRLSLSGCNVTIAPQSGGDALWEDKTPRCEKHVVYNDHLANKCWSADAEILSNDTDRTRLTWSSGRLSLFRDDEVVWQPTQTQGQQLCYQADGNLVIYNSSGGPIWASDSVNPSNTLMTMDRCGISFSWTPNPADQYRRVSSGYCHRTSIKEGWRRTTGAPGNVLGNENVRLDWSSDGHLKLWDLSGNLLWQSPNGNGGHQLEFQGDGNLVIYSSSGKALWAYTWDNGGRMMPESATAVLSLEGCSVAVQNQDLVDKCAVRPLMSTKEATVCDFESWWKLWTMTPSTCLAQLSGGGFSFVKDVKAGNADFGAETWVVAAAVNASSLNALKSSIAPYGFASGPVSADLPTGTPPSAYIEVLGDAGASVTLFGSSVTVLEANGYVENLNGPKDHFDLTVMGATVYEVSTTGVFNPSVSQEFFSADGQYMLGFIPVTMHADVTGTLGANVNIYGDSSALHAETTPYASLDLDGSVGVGVSGASAGVKGSLNLVRLSVPFNQSLTFATKKYTSSASLDIGTLEGELKLYAELGPFEASKKIASFDGYSSTISLFNLSGSL